MRLASDIPLDWDRISITRVANGVLLSRDDASRGPTEMREVRIFTEYDNLDGALKLWFNRTKENA